MNQPSTVGKNWRWRVKAEQITAELAEEMANLAKRYGRMNWAAAQIIEQEEKEKKALKEKLKAEIKAELAAEMEAELQAAKEAEAETEEKAE